MIKIKEKLKEYLSVKKITKLEFYNNINVANGYLDKKGSINSDVLATILIKIMLHFNFRYHGYF